MEKFSERFKGWKNFARRSSRGRTEDGHVQEDHSNWVMEVYKSSKDEDMLRAAEEDILVLDLGEEEDEISKQYLAMATYYSRKSYKSKVLIAEMLHAWGIQKLALAKKVGDYIFKLEFDMEEEKRRAL
jgi:hypothetical protein